jgi:hypothetical protein
MATIERGASDAATSNFNNPSFNALLALDSLLAVSGASFERKLRRLQRLTSLTLSDVSQAVSRGNAIEEFGRLVPLKRAMKAFEV